jgi:hypothetical protein
VEETATAATHALSVYYPFCLIEVIGLREGDDHAETGEVLLSFLDADGCQVTLRLSPHALAALRKRITAEPDPHAK